MHGDGEGISLLVTKIVPKLGEVPQQSAEYQYAYLVHIYIYLWSSLATAHPPPPAHQPTAAFCVLSSITTQLTALL